VEIAPVPNYVGLPGRGLKRMSARRAGMRGGGVCGLWRKMMTD
jgi:hypothetical protein